jgi:uncharacterized protein YdhG (YjbR/CyaY superfamily)
VSVAGSVDEYIDAQPLEVQARLREMREIVLAAVPAEAAEVISYGVPTYKFKGGFVSFGAARRHVALYGPGMLGLEDELRAYSTSRGTVRFPLNKPLPADLVRRLVEGKVRACAASAST